VHGEVPHTVTRTVRRFARYVALGDSSTEGLDDPAGDGRYRGWADRLAVHVARAQGELLYANLAVRGRRTREILQQQLEPALAMRPELATVFSGTNDIIRSGFELDAVLGDIGTMQRALRDAGATVLTFTMPDLSEVMPLARRVAPRLLAFNAAVRALGAETGTIVVDLALHPVAADPRLWSDDRLHANSRGHERIAAALADALGLPDADADWHRALPPLPVVTLAQRVAAELRWTQRHFVPWVWRHARGRSSGDGIQPKRPALAPVELPPYSDPIR
jgi:lysophospholipase L1-like esterase